MPRPTIENVRGVGDFATLYQWNLAVITPAPGVPGFPSSDQVNYRCESSSMPGKTDQELVIGIRGHEVYQPGKHVYKNPLTITFIDTVDSVIADWIESWSNACWEVRTGRQLQNDQIKSNLLLERLDRQDNVIFNYLLVGCYLQDFDLGTLGAENELFKPVLTLKYDYYEAS